MEFPTYSCFKCGTVVNIRSNSQFKILHPILTQHTNTSEPMTWSLARTTQLSLCSTEFTARDMMSWPSAVQRGENRTQEITLQRVEMSFVTIPCWRNPTISKQQTTVIAHSHCTGPGQGHGPGNDGFLHYAMYCTHYKGIETGAGNHCFLLCSSLSLSLSWSRSRAVCISHNVELWDWTLRLAIPSVFVCISSEINLCPYSISFTV